MQYQLKQIEQFNVTSPSINQTFRFDGTKWVNNSEVLITSAGDLTMSGNLLVQGNMTINGTTSTVNTENLLVEDPIILLASTQSGTPTLDSGFFINRGSSATQSLLWDESTGQFAFITTSDSHEASGNVTITGYSSLRVGGFTLTDGTESTDYILVSDTNGVASWTAASNVTSDLTGLGVDNRIARWNGTDIIQSSDWFINDSGVLYPNTDGQDIGITGSNRIGNIYMRSTIDYASTGDGLTFTEDGTDRMIIATGTGWVGIGTSVPGGVLDIIKSASSGILFRAKNATGGNLQINASTMLMQNSGSFQVGPVQAFQFTDTNVSLRRHGAGNVTLTSDVTGSSGIAERSVLHGTKDGRVGIGKGVADAWDGNITPMPANATFLGEGTQSSTKISAWFQSDETEVMHVLGDGNVGIGTGGASASDTLHLVGSFRYVDGNETDGYVLISNATGVASWTASSNVGSTVSELNDLSDVTTDLPGSPTFADDGRLLHFDSASGLWGSDDIVNHANVVINCYSGEAGTIDKGTPVYLTGTFSNDLQEVAIADASDPTKMPVIGFAAEDVTTSTATSNHVTTFGKLQGVDTTSGGDISGGESWSAGDLLYMDTVAGTLTTVRPVGASTGIQRIAQVLRVDASGGQLFIFNTARTAGLPNLLQNNVWVGNSNNQPVTSTFSFEYLNDVTLTSATLNDTLRYDGSDWVNSSNVTIDSGGTMSVSGNLIVDTNNLYVDATSNYIGIGTTVPASRVHIVHSGEMNTSIGHSLEVNTTITEKVTGGDGITANYMDANYTGVSVTNHHRTLYVKAMTNATTGPSFYRYAVYGDGYDASDDRGVGIFGRAGSGSSRNIGVYGNLIVDAGTTENYAVYGQVQMSGGSGAQKAGYFYTAVSNASNTGDLYGVHGNATRTSAAIGTGTNYGAYFQASGGNLNYSIVVPSGGGSAGFGTITPTDTLHVDGTFRYVDGAETSGYILTTDGDGVASWTASSNVVTGDGNGIFDVANDGGTVPTAFDTNLTDAWNIDQPDSTSAVNIRNITTGNANLNIISSSASAGQAILKIDAQGTNRDAYVHFANNTTYHTMGLDSSDSNKFKIGTTAITVNTAFTIDTSQQIGIGTTSPSQKLHVVGTGLITTGLGVGPLAPTGLELARFYSSTAQQTAAFNRTAIVVTQNSIGNTYGFSLSGNWGADTNIGSRILPTVFGPGSTKIGLDIGGAASLSATQSYQPIRITNYTAHDDNYGLYVQIRNGQNDNTGVYSTLTGGGGGGNEAGVNRAFEARLAMAQGLDLRGYDVTNSSLDNSTHYGFKANLIGKGSPVNVLQYGAYLSVSGGTENIAIAVEDGNVGFGVTGPSEQLHVVGNFRYVDGNETAGYVLKSDANGVASWTSSSVGGTDLTGLGTDDRIARWNGTDTLQDSDWFINDSGVLYPNTDGQDIGITGSNRIGNIYMSSNIDYASTGSGLSFTEDETLRLIIDTGGDVGVGTASPNQKLHVYGNVNIDNGKLYMDGVKMMGHETGSTGNLSIGELGMNTDTISGAIRNTTVGYDAGGSITSGDSNTFLGWGAGRLISTESNNTALGALALYSNTGAGNVAIGVGALDAVSSVGTSVAVGYQALSAITSGATNIAIGYNAMFATPDGSYNIAIGTSAGPTTTGGISNSLSFGRAAIPTASNQALYGSALSPFTDHYFGRGVETNGGGAIYARLTTSGIAEGNSDTNANATMYVSGAKGTGTGDGGDLILQLSPPGSTGTASNPLVDTMTFDGSTGFVGVLTTPSQQFHVNGNIRSDDSYFFSSDRFIHTGNIGSMLNCTFLGVNSGNVTGSGNSNTGVGRYTLPAITTGRNNFAGGVGAGRYLTTGWQNILIGESAGGNSSATNLQDNVMIGYLAGQSRTSGIGNVFIGLFSGFQGTGGNYNTAVGWRSSSDGTISSSIAIGKYAYSKTSNTMVIGGAPSQGNAHIHTVYIGSGEDADVQTDLVNIKLQATSIESGVLPNEPGKDFTFAGSQGSGTGSGGDLIFQVATPAGASSSTQNSLSTSMTIYGDNGYVGIGETEPTDTLHLDGTFRYVDGGEADGYILKSDADGVGSWTAYKDTDTRSFTASTPQVVPHSLGTNDLHIQIFSSTGTQLAARTVTVIGTTAVSIELNQTLSGVKTVFIG